MYYFSSCKRITYLINEFNFIPQVDCDLSSFLENPGSLFPLPRHLPGGEKENRSKKEIPIEHSTGLHGKS
jgi:hypothetical protein